MDFIGQELLEEELVPVLLGISKEASRTSRRFFRKYGTVSHLFCDRIPFGKRLSLSAKYHILPSPASDRLMLRALEDFASQLENADVILYLIPCTEHYANLVWENHALLERIFVIANQSEMERVWFGEELQKEGNQ